MSVKSFQAVFLFLRPNSLPLFFRFVVLFPPISLAFYLFPFLPLSSSQPKPRHVPIYERHILTVEEGRLVQTRHNEDLRTKTIREQFNKPPPSKNRLLPAPTPRLYDVITRNCFDPRTPSDTTGVNAAPGVTQDSRTVPRPPHEHSESRTPVTDQHKTASTIDATTHTGEVVFSSRQSKPP